MTRHKRADWARLGAAVMSARLRKGWDMPDWADQMGRSTRLLQGLERGETVGPETLRRIEQELKWQPGWADVILSDPEANRAPDLIGTDTAESLAAIGVDLNPELGHYTDHELVARTQTMLTEIEQRMLLLATRLHAKGEATLGVISDDHHDVITSRPPQQ